ncbi:hypothetical protein [Uliginosibacterium sediminicola]|uniref:Uncharacterized protein n=1 Tax=Uliginosibacterium sediminicola TaxID=2024550 RepID=A0ABU9YT42_9RHOO
MSIEYMNAWQCIGCGKIDGPQNCVGICQDRKVELVYAADYEALQSRLDASQALLAVLSAQMREIVNTQPRNAEWERNYRALQARAAKALATVERHPAATAIKR